MNKFTIIAVMLFGFWMAKPSAVWSDNNAELRLDTMSDFAQNDLDPNNGPDQWRFVPYIGWRKFAPIDAFYKDWRDYRRTTRPYWWR